MYRALAKVAAISGVVAGVSLAAALAIGGPELRRSGIGFDNGLRPGLDDHGRPATGAVREQSNFTAIDAGGGVETEVIVGPAFRVEVLGPHPEHIMTRLEGGALRIRPRGHLFWWGHDDLPAVRIAMPALAAIRSSAGARVGASGVNADTLDLRANSGARIDASGTCRDVHMEASSGAELRTAALICQSGHVDASSGADLDVNVSGKLDVDASSGATVRNAAGAKPGLVSLHSGADLVTR